MSGGSYDYAYRAPLDMADELERRKKASHVLAFASHLRVVAEIMRRIEWVDSGDDLWEDDLDEMIRAVVTPAMEMKITLDGAREAERDLHAAIARAERHTSGPHPDRLVQLTGGPADGTFVTVDQDVLDFSLIGNCRCGATQYREWHYAIDRKQNTGAYKPNPAHDAACDAPTRRP